MSWAFPFVQGIEHHKLRRATQKSSTRGSVSVKSRHEPVPQPEGQSASRPERLVTQPCPLTVFPGRGRHVPAPAGGTSGLFFLWCAPSSSALSSFVFPCWFPGSCLEAGRCAVATPAIRGVSRGGCVPHLLVAVRFPPDSKGQLHQEHRAPTQEPHIFSGIPLSTYAVGTQ